jgi:hypothetical protein
LLNYRPIADNAPVLTQRDQLLDGGFQPIVQLVGSMMRSTRNHAETALVQAKSMPKGTMPPSVGMGRSVKLTGVEILRRMHVVLGHLSLQVLLATLMASKDLNAW